MASRGEVQLRFEDIAQDGRVRLAPLASSLGVVWRQEMEPHPLYAHCRDQGILPITTRFLIEAEPGPFAVEKPVTVDARFDLCRTVDAKGATTRLLLDLHTELSSVIGRTTLPPPDDAGRPARMGRLLAQHVFTRPFADPKERRVLDLGDFARDAATVEWPEPSALLEVPAGARRIRPLDLELWPVVFGAMHTDSNQHVNSLVYAHVFEELAVRHLGLPTALARRLDIRFRKPSFAGDRLNVALTLWEHEGKVHASGTFVDEHGDPEHGRVFVLLTFEP